MSAHEGRIKGARLIINTKNGGHLIIGRQFNGKSSVARH